VERKVTLPDVCNYADAENDDILGPIDAYIVNFEVVQQWPKKFFYKACTALQHNGTFCATSAKAASKGCLHPDCILIVGRMQLQCINFECLLLIPRVVHQSGARFFMELRSGWV
jgi:hypothetical protein